MGEVPEIATNARNNTSFDMRSHNCNFVPSLFKLCRASIPNTYRSKEIIQLSFLEYLADCRVI
jgi:hypothetical protein